MTALLPATLLLTLAAAPSKKIALVDLDTTMVGMASQVTQALTLAATQQELTIVSAEEVRTRLGTKKYNELVKCAGRPNCVGSLLSGQRDLDRAISGSLAIDDKFYVLKLALIDLKSLEVVADVNRSILIASRRFPKDVKELAGPLVKGEREARGKLVVTTNARDAQVTVNGEFIGVAPVTLQLKPGKHEVKVERPKYLPVTRLVDLEANQTFTAEIRMILKPGEKVEEEVPALVAKAGAEHEKQGIQVRPPTIIAGAAALLAFGVGTVFGIQSSSGEKRLLAGYNQASDTYSGTRVEALGVRNNATIANVSFGVAGAALVVTGVLLVLDIKAASAPVEVAPVATPDGAGVLIGASVRGRF